jgi:hypothetical protein
MVSYGHQNGFMWESNVFVGIKWFPVGIKWFHVGIKWFHVEIK